MNSGDPFVSLDAQVTVQGLPSDTALALRLLWGHGVDSVLTRSITVRSGPIPSAPSGTAVSVIVARTPLPVHVRGDELWLGENLHLSVQGRNVVLTVGDGSVPEEAWLLAMTEAHRVGGWLPLHAAVLT